MKIDTQIKNLESRLEKLKAKQSTARSRKRVYCYECQKYLTIGNLVYYIEEFYVEPYGCTGGDYYKSSDDEHFYVCSTCNIRHRMNWRPDLRALKRYFKETEYINDDDVKEKHPNFINVPELETKKKKRK